MRLPAHAAGYERLPAYPLADVPETRRRLRERGVDVVDLGAGDADLPPPPTAVRRLREAASDPASSRYPFQLGLPELREALAGWMGRRFGVDVDPMAELLPLIGSKEGIAKLPLAFLDPGDVAILPDPGYQAYRGGVLLAGGEPYAVPLRAENDFLLLPRELPDRVVDRAKLLYLNYPNNPTTAAAPPDYLQRVVDFCRSRSLVLVHDHAYSEIAFDGYRPPSVLEMDRARDVALEFHSFSKTYNMTGWRLGWAAGGSELVATLSRVKTFMDTGVFLAVQAAGLGALESYDEWVPSNVQRFRERRDVAVETLSSAGYAVSRPRATMYLWIPIPGPGSSAEFARRALEEEGVVVLPGSALGDGGEGFFRVALTVSRDRLREGTARLARLLA